MIAVIIAGGSGSRLWPLSTPKYPKHLLKLVGDKSLLQNTYDRAKKVARSIYVVTESSHVEHVYKQLPKLNNDEIIVEPARRGTAGCVLIALNRIKKDAVDPNEAIIFMHADHHIRDINGFVECISGAESATNKSGYITLLGVEPTYAATGFGYIERGGRAADSSAFVVKSFKEKPNLITAQKYVTKGNYLWNMGYFIASLNTFEAQIKRYSPDMWKKYADLTNIEQKRLPDLYMSFDSQPIDTALIERARNLMVVPGNFDWIDLGSYPDVHQVSIQDDKGNSIRGNSIAEDSVNSLIRNDGNIPLVVIGVDNVAVIATNDGILVLNKSYAQKVGEVSKRIRS